VKAPHFQQPQRLIRKGRGGEGQLLWSPDGQKLVFTGSRPGDSWSTIWVADVDGSHLRDLLPPEAPEWVNSGGVRSLGLSTWLSNHEIAFDHGCGTECADLYKLDVDKGTYQTLSQGEMVAGGYYWAPTQKWAIVETHLGGLGLVAAASPERPARSVLGGCLPEEGEIQGAGVFDDWSPNGRQVLYTAQACEEGVPSATEFNLFVWEVESS